MALTALAQRRVAKTGLTIGLIIGAVFAAGPVLWMLSSSFKSNTQIFELPPRLITDTFSFDAYIAIFTNPETMRFFLNSYIVAGSVTILTLLVAIQAAYAFSRFEFRGKRILNVVIVSVQAVPPITLLIPYFGLMVALGLYNSYLGLILTYMVFTLPYAILLMTGFLNTLPKDLDEAVLVDGGSSWTALWRVIVPLSVPGIVATAVYTFLLAWNEFLFAVVLIESWENRVLTMAIYSLMAEFVTDWNAMMAFSVLASLPLVVAFIFLQRYMVQGMTAGALTS